VKSKIDRALGKDNTCSKFVELMETEEFSNLQNRHSSLMRNIQDYYKSRLNLEFSRYGEVGVKKLLNEIIRFELNKDKNIAEHTEFISYHLKTFVKKLIENK
jgi:DNA-binding ferritin-like protein (Dps family)